MDIASSVGKIQVLPSDVIGRIAAGEVVERPAAVVKELVENSLDAGSSTITVEVKDGGLGLIRVTDDGEGMSRRDASLAFERHATSKLQSDQQLGTICTMGFRGEALPSIAAVSKVRLTTLSRQEQVGHAALAHGGDHHAGRRCRGDSRDIHRGFGALLQYARPQEISQIDHDRVLPYQPCGAAGRVSVAAGTRAVDS
jgi:DNA mismatch repair protein MutL